MSEVLPYDQWVESEEAMGLGELEKLKGYGDHYRFNSFSSGNYNQEEADEVNKHLFGLALGRGLVDQTDPEVAAQQFQEVEKRGITPEDVGGMVNHMEATGGTIEDIQNLRVHHRHLENPETMPDVLAASNERVAPLLSPDKLRRSEVAAVQRGEKPLSVFEGEDGTLDIRWDPNLEGLEMTDAQIAEHVKADPTINSNYLPAIRAARERPDGLTVSRSTAVQIHEAKVVINNLQGEDIDSYKEAIVSELRQGDLAGAEEVARDATRHPGVLKQEYSEGVFVNAFMDWGKQTVNKDTPQILSTGEIVMPRKFLVDPEKFDAGVDALDVSEGQKKLAKNTRVEYLKAASPRFHKLATSFGMSEYVDLYEKRKAEGKQEHEIVEEWFSDDERFSKLAQVGQSLFFATLEAGAGATAYPAALLGNEEAKQMMGSLMKHEMARQEYADLFGVKLSGKGSGMGGFGYTLMRTAPAIAIDIAISIPTGGVLGGASAAIRAGARWSVRQGMKLTFAQTLSASTKSLTAKALAGTGRVSVALTKTGNELSTFMQKVYPRTRGTRYASAAAFNRQAGATYVSMHDTLSELHPDWTPEQVREAAYGHAVWSGAITVAIINTMGVLAVTNPKLFGEGVEAWAAGSNTGLTIRQLNGVYKNVVRKPDPSLKGYIKLDTFEEFATSLYKESVKKVSGALLRHGFSEGIEEGVDQVVNGFRDQLYIAQQGGEDMDILGLFHESLTAAGAGFVFGLGGGTREAGFRSRVTDRQRGDAEVDFYSRIQDQLAKKGDLQSAAVLGGLVNKAREDRTLVTSELEELGAEAKKEMAAIDEKNLKPFEKIPQTPGDLQRKIAKIEEYIEQLEASGTQAGFGPAGRRQPAYRRPEGVEGPEDARGVFTPGARTPETMRAIAGARHYRERLLALYEESQKDKANVTPRKETKAGEVPIADPTTGEPMSPLRDSGSATKIIDEKYNAKTEEEAQPIIANLNSEISRLESVGAISTPYQTQRLRHLLEQRDALREKFYPGMVERTPPANPKLQEKLENVERALGALQVRERKNPSLATDSQHRGRVQVQRSKRRALREAIAEGSNKANAPITSSVYPIEKLLRLMATPHHGPLAEGDRRPWPPQPAEGRGVVYNPETGEVFEPRVEPKKALALLKKAQQKKDARDNATLRKTTKDQKVTKAELDSLTEGSPEELFKEDFERINALVSLFDERAIDLAADPELARKLAVLSILEINDLAKKEEDATNLIPASATEEESRQAAENTEIPEPEERHRYFENEDPEAEPQIISVRRNATAGKPVRNPFGNLDERSGSILSDNGAIVTGAQGDFVVVVIKQRPTTVESDPVPEENPSFVKFKDAEAAAGAIVSSLGEVEGMSFTNTLFETDAESEEAAAVSEGKLEEAELGAPPKRTPRVAGDARATPFFAEDMGNPDAARKAGVPSRSEAGEPAPAPTPKKPKFVKISDGEYRVEGTGRVVRKAIDADEKHTGEWELMSETPSGELEWHETYDTRKEAGAAAVSPDAEAPDAEAPDVEASGIVGITERIAQRAERAADKAMEDIRKELGGGKVSMGIDPTLLGKVAIVGSKYIARGIADFTKWSAEMIAAFKGILTQKQLDPKTLRKIFNESKAIHAEALRAEEEAAPKRTPRVAGDARATPFFAEDMGNPDAARKAGVPSRPDTVSPDTVTPVNQTAAEAQAELVATRLEAIISNETEAKIIEKKVKEVQGKTTKVIGPFFSKFHQAVKDHPKAEFTAENAGAMLAVQTNSKTPWDPSKDSSGKAKHTLKKNEETGEWQAVWGVGTSVRKDRRGKPLANQPIIVPLSQSTLYDTDGNPGFPAESDRLLFEEIVESGARPEPRHLTSKTAMGRRVTSLSQTYITAFLDTAEAELEKRSPVIPPPVESTSKKDPDPALQEDKVRLEYVVLNQRGSGNAVYTYDDLVARERELEVKAASLRSHGEERAEQDAIDAARGALVSAEAALEETDLESGYGSPEAEEWYSLTEILEGSRRSGQEGLQKLRSLQEEYANTPRDEKGAPIVLQLPDISPDLPAKVAVEELQEWLDQTPEGRYPLDSSAYGLADPEVQLFLVVTKRETDDGVAAYGNLEASIPNPNRVGARVAVPVKSRKGDYDVMYTQVEKDLFGPYQRRAGADAREEATAYAKENKKDLRKKKTKEAIEKAGKFAEEYASVPPEAVHERVIDKLGDLVDRYLAGADPVTGEWSAPSFVVVSDIKKMVPLEGMTPSEFEARHEKAVALLDTLRFQSDAISDSLSEMTRPGEDPRMQAAEARAFEARDNWHSTLSDVDAGAYRYAKVKKELDMVRSAIGLRPANTEITLAKAKDPKQISRRRGTVTRMEFDPEHPKSHQQRIAAQEFYKSNYRGLRSETANRKISRQGFTQNGSLPMLLKSRRNKEGNIEYNEEVFFTNDPKQMAMAHHLGYTVRIPKEYLKGGAKEGELNPAIKPDLGGRGIIGKVFDPITRMWVRQPGDLTKWSGEEAYTITEVNRNSKRALYAEALLPVPASHTPHLGDTVFGQEAASVGSLYHTETIGGRLLTPQERLELAEEKLPGFKSIEQVKQEFRDTHKDPKTGRPLEISDDRVDSFRSAEEKEVLAQIPLHTPLTRTRDGAPDEAWMQAARDYFDGIGKGPRRASVRSNLDKESKRSLTNYTEAVDRLVEELAALKGIQADEHTLAEPQIAQDILEELGGRSLSPEERQTILEREGRVNLAQLDSLVKAAEEDHRNKEAEKAEKEKAVESEEADRTRTVAGLTAEITKIDEEISKYRHQEYPEETRDIAAKEEDPGDPRGLEALPEAEQEILRGHRQQKQDKQDELEEAQKSSDMDATDNYKTKLSIHARLIGSGANPEAIAKAKRELDEAARDMEAVTVTRLDYQQARDAAEKALSNLERLQLVQRTVEEIRERLGEDPVPITLEDTIKEVTKELEKEIENHRFTTEEIHRKGVELEGGRVSRGSVIRKDIEELKELIEKVGGNVEDAKFDALIMYQQDIREFGLAVQLIELPAGQVREEWLRKLLDVEEKQKGLDPATGRGGKTHSLDRKAKEDFMNYLRSRFSVKQTPEISLEEVEQTLERFAGEIPLDEQTSEITLTEAQVRELKGAAKTKVDQNLASRLGTKTELKGKDLTRLYTLADKAAKADGLHPSTRKSLEKLSDPKNKETAEEFLKNVKRRKKPTRDKAKAQAKQRIMLLLEDKNKKGKLYSVKSLKRALSGANPNLRGAVEYLNDHFESEYGSSGAATDSVILRNYIDLLLDDLDPTHDDTREWRRTRWSREEGGKQTPTPFKNIIVQLTVAYRMKLRTRGPVKIQSIDEGVEQLDNPAEIPSDLVKQLASSLVTTPEGYQEGFMGFAPGSPKEVTSEKIHDLRDDEFHLSILDALNNPQATEAMRAIYQHLNPEDGDVSKIPVHELWLTTYETLLKSPKVIEDIREEAPELARMLQKVFQSGAKSVGLQLGNELMEVIDENRTAWATILSKALSSPEVKPRTFTEAKTGKRITGTFVSARGESIVIKPTEGPLQPGEGFLGAPPEMLPPVPKSLGGAVGIDPTSIRIRTGKGKEEREVTIPAARLSEEDLQYVRNQTVRTPAHRDLVSEGLTPTQARSLLHYMVNEDASLSPQDRQLFAGVLKALDEHGQFPSITFLTNPSISYALWKGAYGEKSQTLYFNLTQRNAHKMGSLLRGLVVHAVNTVPQGTEAHAALLKEGRKIRKVLAAENMQEVYLTPRMEPEQGLLVPESEIRERVSERMERRSPDEEVTPAEIAGQVRAEQRVEDRRAFTFALLNPEASDLMARRDTNFIDRIVNVLAKVLGLKGNIAKKRIRAYASPEKGSLFIDRPQFVRSDDMTVPSEMRPPLEILEGLTPPGHSIIYTPVSSNPAFTYSGAPNTIFVNPEVVLSMVNGLPPHAIESVLQTLVDHELAHLSSIEVLTNADRASIITDISPTDMAEVMARVPEDSGNIEIAEEYLRMKGEEAAYGVDGDRFVYSVLNYGTGLRAQILRHVESVLYKLATRFSKRSRPSLKTSLLMQRIKERMDRVKRGDIPLQPVASQDINDYWEPLNEMGAQGTDRVFFSVPVWSSDGSHIENMDELKRNWKSTMKRELNLIEKGIQFADSAESVLMKDLTKQVHRAIRKGLVSTETVNAALGSLDAVISPEAQANLNAQREAERAAMASAKGTLTKDQEKELLENHTKRLAETGRAVEKERVRKMQLAQMAVDKADPNLGATIKAYRSEIASMSRAVGGSKGGATKLLFDSKAETHLIRSYEFFHSSVYRQAILDNGTLPGVDVSKLWNDALDSVIEVYKEEGTGKKLTPEQLRGKASTRLNTWLKSLAEQPPDSVQPLSVLSKGKDLFKERQDITDPIQALLGVRRPIASAMHTHTKLAIFLAKTKAAEDLRKLLLSSGWVKTEPDFPNSVNTKLWSEYTGDEEYAPLQGLYATRGDAAIIHEAMEQLLPLKADKSDSSADIVQGLGAKVWEGAKQAPRKIAGTSLMMKTVGSVGHFARNEGSMNYVLRPLNGDFTSLLWFIPGTKFSGFRHADLARQGLGLGRIKDGDREYVSELIRRGMIKDGVTAGLLGDIFDNTGDPVMQMREDIEAWDKGEPPASWIKKVWKGYFSHLGTNPIASKLGRKGTPQFLTLINEFIDSKAKIGLYEFEKSFLVKVRDEIGGAGPEWTDEAISQKAAAKVHATLPGHSQVWKPVKEFTGSAAGLLAFPFARFASETLRGYLGTARLIPQEWGEGNRIGSSVMKRRAAMRAVGFVGTQVFVSKALVTVFAAIFNALGDDDDEQGTGKFKKLKREWGRAHKRGLPKWMRNQTVYVRHNPGAGSDTMLNMTYFTPLSILGDPTNVFLDSLAMGEGFDEAAVRLAETILVDVAGEGIAFGAFREMLSNSNEYGQKIFLPGESVPDRFKKILLYTYDEAFKPGIHSKGEQFVKAIKRNKESDDGTRRYNARSILLGEVLGVRPQEYMTDETMKKSARSVKRDLDAIKAILKPLTSGRRLKPGESTELVHKYVDAYKDMWRQHIHTAEAWTEYTGDPGAYEKYMGHMIEAGHSKSRTYGVMMEKTLDRFVRNREGMENIFNAGESSGAEGGEVRLDEFVQAILEYPEGMDLRE